MTAELGGRVQKHALLGFSDATLAAEVADALHPQGIVSTLAFTQDQVVEAVSDERYRLLLLDGSLVTDSFLSSIESIRRRARLPLLAYADLPVKDIRRFGGLLDAHLPPEDDPARLVALAAALIDATQPLSDIAQLRWGPLELDAARREARWDGDLISFTPVQFRMMEMLILAAGDVLTSRDLSEKLWGNSFDDSERIQAHIRRIRKKIERDPSQPSFLLTVRGEGFRLADPAKRTENDPDIRKGSTAT